MSKILNHKQIRFGHLEIGCWKYVENSFVTPSLTLPPRGGGVGWGAFSWFAGDEPVM